MNMISLLCPSRGRPKIFERMLLSIAETVSDRKAIEVVVYFDDDDPTVPQYAGLEWPVRVVTHVAPRIVMSDMWNELIPKATADILMLAGDDVVFKTKDWDRQVENAFDKCPDKILLVYGDDCGPGGKVFATHPFVHRRWIEIVGYFTGPGFSCDYADAWPQDVADMIGRKRFLDFVNEHMHAIWGKAEFDQTYKESNARLHRDNTPKKYLDTLDLRKADAEKLRLQLGTKWERQLEPQSVSV